MESPVHLLWFVCKFCKRAFPCQEKLIGHKKEAHAEEIRQEKRKSRSKSHHRKHTIKTEQDDDVKCNKEGSIKSLGEKEQSVPLPSPEVDDRTKKGVHLDGDTAIPDKVLEVVTNGGGQEGSCTGANVSTTSEQGFDSYDDTGVCEVLEVVTNGDSQADFDTGDNVSTASKHGFEDYDDSLVCVLVRCLSPGEIETLRKPRAVPVVEESSDSDDGRKPTPVPVGEESPKSFVTDNSRSSPESPAISVNEEPTALPVIQDTKRRAVSRKSTSVVTAEESSRNAVKRNPRSKSCKRFTAPLNRKLIRSKKLRSKSCRRLNELTPDRELLMPTVPERQQPRRSAVQPVYTERFVIHSESNEVDLKPSLREGLRTKRSSKFSNLNFDILPHDQIWTDSNKDVVKGGASLFSLASLRKELIPTVEIPVIPTDDTTEDDTTTAGNTSVESLPEVNLSDDKVPPSRSSCLNEISKSTEQPELVVEKAYGLSTHSCVKCLKEFSSYDTKQAHEVFCARFQCKFCRVMCFDRPSLVFHEVLKHSVELGKISNLKSMASQKSTLTSLPEEIRPATVQVDDGNAECISGDHNQEDASIESTENSHSQNDVLITEGVDVECDKVPNAEDSLIEKDTTPIIMSQDDILMNDVDDTCERNTSAEDSVEEDTMPIIMSQGDILLTDDVNVESDKLLNVEDSVKEHTIPSVTLSHDDILITDIVDDEPDKISNVEGDIIDNVNRPGVLEHEVLDPKLTNISSEVEDAGPLAEDLDVSDDESFPHIIKIVSFASILEPELSPEGDTDDVQICSDVTPTPCLSVSSTEPLDYAITSAIASSIQILSTETQVDHEDSDVHMCEQCGQFYRDFQVLKRHCGIRHATKPFKCHNCNKCFQSRISLTQHGSNCSNLKKLLNRKKKSQKTLKFILKAIMRKHRDYFQLPSLKISQLRSNRKRKMYTCKHCSKLFRKGSPAKKLLFIQHVHAIHKIGGSASYLCSECGKSFHSERYFRKHTLSHYPRDFSCHTCPRKFSNRWQLHQHTKRNLLEAPANCEQCLISYASKCQMKPHEQSHLAVPVISSEIPNQSSEVSTENIEPQDQPVYRRTRQGRKMSTTMEYANLKMESQTDEGPRAEKANKPERKSKRLTKIERVVKEEPKNEIKNEPVELKSQRKTRAKKRNKSTDKKKEHDKVVKERSDSQSSARRTSLRITSKDMPEANRDKRALRIRIPAESFLKKSEEEATGIFASESPRKRLRKNPVNSPKDESLATSYGISKENSGKPVENKSTRSAVASSSKKSPRKISIKVPAGIASLEIPTEDSGKIQKCLRKRVKIVAKVPTSNNNSSEFAANESIQTASKNSVRSPAITIKSVRKSPVKTRESRSSEKTPVKTRNSCSSEKHPGKAQGSRSSEKSPVKIRKTGSSEKTRVQNPESGSSEINPGTARTRGNSLKSPTKSLVKDNSVKSPTKNRESGDFQKGHTKALISPFKKLSLDDAICLSKINKSRNTDLGIVTRAATTKSNRPKRLLRKD